MLIRFLDESNEGGTTGTTEPQEQAAAEPQERAPIELTPKEKEILERRDDDVESPREKPNADEENSGVVDEGVSPQLRELGRSYGLDDKEIDLYGSNADLQRTLLLFDRQLVNRGQSSFQQPPARQEQPMPPAAKAEPAQPRLPAVAVEQRPTDGKFRFDFGPNAEDDMDPVVLKNFQDLEKHLHDRFDALDRREAEQQQAAQHQAMQREIDSFDAFVEGLGNEELFGKSKKAASEPQFENRKNVWANLMALRAGYQAVGKGDTPLSKELVHRAYNLAFQEQVLTQQRKALTSKIRSQSSRRTFAAGTQRVGSIQAGEKSPASALANHPAIKAAWNDMQQENDG